MEQKYIQKIAERQSLSVKQILNVHELSSGGATVPFMSRYRKEATGNLDEVQLNNIVEDLKYFSELDKRKETVLKTIEGLGKLSPELKARIDNSFDATELEDLYLPYKPKRKTRATAAIEKGLEPLAKWLLEQQPGNPEEAAATYITEEVKDEKAALQGARDIIAEWVTDDARARTAIRNLFESSAVLYSKVLSSKKEDAEAQKYRDYFEFSESLSSCPSHRILAIRRGEKEGILMMDINVDKTKAIDELNQLFIKADNDLADQVRKAVEDGYDRLLKSSIENEFRLLSKTKADEDAISVFAENLRQLLLASPLGEKNVLAIDPGFRTGCKVVCLDAQGNFIHNSTIYPHPPQQETSKTIAELKKLVQQFNIEAIGVGNGTAGRETEQLVRDIDFGKPVNIFMVNESGASIYSASEVAREEFPEQDVTVRGAISIGRRLLDPLSELVKIDPKSIGVGQYQHDVHQTKLKDELDKVVESCVNHVGVDLNTASRHLLNYVSGLSSTLAKNIVDYRAEKGAFKSRKELKKVAMMGPKSFEQCAGFLRIRGAENPLDNSGVHPESYDVVEAMARDLNCSIQDLITSADIRRRIDRRKYITEKTGEFTLEDILRELEKPGRDPRPQIEVFRFDDSVKSIDDLKQGMTLPGIITNITSFGAFVDIGVKQDGLLHISQMSNTFISDPNQVVKLNQKVQVTVLEVDSARKRVSLTMKDAQPSQRAGTPGKKPVVQKSASKNPAPLNPFQAKLEELRKKLK